MVVFKETASGADNGRPERAKVPALARAHKIDAILVTELTRWGRSTQDLVQTLDDLHGWKVNVLVSAPQAVRSCAPSWPDWPSSSAI
jgi:putative DNA-invertase from lambdoid prophage Rac